LQYSQYCLLFVILIYSKLLSRSILDECFGSKKKKLTHFKETVNVRPFNHTVPPSFLSSNGNTSEQLVNQNQQARYYMHPDYLNIVNAVKPKRSITPKKVLQIERSILNAQKQALEEAGSNQEKRNKVDLSYSF